MRGAGWPRSCSTRAAPALPQYDLGPAGNGLREQAQAWLEENWSGERKAEFDAKPFSKREFDAEFARDIGKTGWIGLGWPKEFGGQARSPIEQIAFMETMERGEAPRIGAAIQANALMMFGTPEQQREISARNPSWRGHARHGLQRATGRLRSRGAAHQRGARRRSLGHQWPEDLDHDLVGKIHVPRGANRPEAKPPHAGISMFIVPMDTPGITIRPATTMYDGSFANIFYDDVRIPLENIVGEVNGGWKVLTGALAFERGLVGGGIVLKVAHAFEQLRRPIAGEGDGDRSAPGDDPIVRDRMATLACEIEVGRQLMMHCAELAADGITPPEYGAISKVFSGELMERFGEAALDILGMRAALSEQMPGAIDNGRFEQNLRHSLMWVISIGTNEIQRSLIAQRGARAAEIGVIACKRPESATPPLEGIRVLDFSIMLAGPYCARLLADVGAEVIKIEPPEGDDMRLRTPLRDGNSAYFGQLNAGKRSLALDLKSAEAIKLVHQLVAEADILVENFRPGVMDRLGLGYEALRKINPRLIYCSISGYGQIRSRRGACGLRHDRSCRERLRSLVDAICRRQGSAGIGGDLRRRHARRHLRLLGDPDRAGSTRAHRRRSADRRRTDGLHAEPAGL